MIRPVTRLDLAGARLLVRADLNVPMRDGTPSDTTRIKRFAAGLRPLLNAGACAVVLSHLGRPKGKPDAATSLRAIAPLLEDALGCSVVFCPEPQGAKAEAMARALAEGEVLLCENVRFLPGEVSNDPKTAAGFARLGEIYVNDAFSASHRAHASTEAVAALLPAFAGPQLMEEIHALQSALEAPERPAVGIIGGAKVSTKIAVLRNLLTKLDSLIIGGAMANTFLLAQGHSVGRSLVEPDFVPTAVAILAQAQSCGCDIELPVDFACAPSPDAPDACIVSNTCPDDAMILDVGPRTVARFGERTARARTLIWNGPLGLFEVPPFNAGTNGLAEQIVRRLGEPGVTAVAGGGDTLAALGPTGAHFTYLSTAGGAFLEWLEGKDLPAIKALETPQA